MRKEPQGTNEIASSGREASVTAVIDTSISGSELQADIKGKALWGAPCPGKASKVLQGSRFFIICHIHNHTGYNR